MKYTHIKIALSLLLILSTMGLHAADAVSFTCEAPSAVVKGTAFQLVYTVNASGKDIRIPQIEHFEIVAGPFKSTSSSMQIVNGNVSSSKSERFTYTLLPNEEGSFTIGSASIIVNKTKYQSNAVTIKVLPPDQADNANSSNQKANAKNNQATNSQQITAENLFILPSVSRTKVMEQEAILLTYKIYSRVDLIDIQNYKFPDFKGFLVQEIDVPKNKQQDLENYKGKNYSTFILRQVLLYPQHPGEIVISPMTCEAMVRIRSQHQVRSIFDSFFDSYQEVKKSLSSGKLTIHASALPTPKPTDFSGAVGEFSLKSSINATTVNVNEPITLTILISGSGNMKMIKTPDITFPSDFENYEPKISNDFSNTTLGVRGTKKIEYLAIPRHDGTFNIPETSFSYFDVKKNTYVTLTTPAYNIAVNKSTNSSSDEVVSNFTNQEKIKQLATDIRYISTQPLRFNKLVLPFVGTGFYWLCLLIPLIIAAALAVLFRKQARENANLALKRNKKANKKVRKRLKIAEREMKAGHKETFYDEILKALWGYLGDKLSIPVTDLNKENIESILAQRQVTDDVITEFITLLNDCEFERYAPLQDSQSAMDHIYSNAMHVITKLEESIKK